MPKPALTRFVPFYHRPEEDPRPVLYAPVRGLEQEEKQEVTRKEWSPEVDFTVDLEIK